MRVVILIFLTFAAAAATAPAAMFQLPILPAVHISGSDAGPEAAPPQPVNPQLPVIPDHKFLLTDYGAVGDGKTLNTAAFRKAIDACNQAGGGSVVVTSGTFVTGPFQLVSNMALVLETGATILAPANFSDWSSPVSSNQAAGSDEVNAAAPPLISGAGLTNIVIQGEGTIDGNGSVWWDRFRQERAAGAPAEGAPVEGGAKPATPRPFLVRLTGCRYVRIEGVTLKDSPKFHLVPHFCQDVLIENVKVIAPSDAPNTDAIDPSSCRNVLIRRCMTDVGDDDICFKSSRDVPPLQDVLVTDCTFKNGHGVSIGSNLGSGLRNITVQKCSFEGTTNGIRIKSSRGRGALVENVTYRDITMKNVGTATTINMFYFDKDAMKAHETKPVTPTTPIVRGIRIINLTCQGAKSAGDITGLPEMPISDVLLQNVTIDAIKGLTIRDAKGVELRDVEVKIQKKGDPIKFADSDVKTTHSDAAK